MIDLLQDQLAHIDADQTWLVGVSGGRDSVCLLDLLVRAGFSNLVVVHVNHQLRGEESAGDAKFVEQLARHHGVDFYSESVDVQQLASIQQKGLELAARETRHEVFAQAMAKYDAAGVLLGHHADDQAETVLYNLLRGSNGLKGMRFENAVKVSGISLMFLRPMLTIRRSDIDAYVNEHGLAYREDASNAEGFTARNRLRKEVMPLLTDIMKREVVPQINTAAESSMEQADFFTNEVSLESFLDPQGRVFLPALSEAHIALQQSILFQYLKVQGVPELSRSVVMSGLEICDSSAPAKVNLPGGNWLRRKEQRLFVQRA
ncbi:tRNA lysidine(34) synthetase TilS [Rubritalea spongiae]|uniref:tRNA(Ile)-lysidine synthase n=1 Tax=Rubritalea spongiae TaxID=430797 RepID=A0ABW5E4L2_9BACT